MRSFRRFTCFTFRMLSGAFVASLFIFAPGVAHAQYVYVSPPPPPPPPPPPRYRYYYRAEPARPYYEETHAFDLGVDLEGAIPVNMPQLPNGNQLQGGSGVKVRFGDQIRISPGFRITPEGGWAYDHMFASDLSGNAYDWDINRVFGGVRFAFGRFVVPSVYGHLGLGWRNSGDPYITNATGLVADAGGALDFRFWRHLQLGVHAEYVTLALNDYAPQWVALGGHVDFVF